MMRGRVEQSMVFFLCIRDGWRYLDYLYVGFISVIEIPSIRASTVYAEITWVIRRINPKTLVMKTSIFASRGQCTSLFRTRHNKLAPHRINASKSTPTSHPRFHRFINSIISAASNNQLQQTAITILPETEIPGMTAFLDSIKWDNNGLAVAIAQHIDTGEVLMQAFADRTAVSETMQTKLATFYSRSRKGRWCKGETSGNFIKVVDMHLDCDRDSLIYLSEPIGPACHTNADTCYFTQLAIGSDSGVSEAGDHHSRDASPMNTFYALERTIEQRRAAAAAAGVGEQKPGEKPSWTARLLSDNTLLCKKVREEAGELCETLENDEGKERAASEAADLFYHAMVLLNAQGVKMEEVAAVLRGRFGVSGIEEKAARPPKSSS
jgi:phosphoribosyl-AMP cyclohydrolase / phosphoribosyl-ATP pyrophosphohydrolase